MEQNPEHHQRHEHLRDTMKRGKNAESMPYMHKRGERSARGNTGGAEGACLRNQVKHAFNGGHAAYPLVEGDGPGLAGVALVRGAGCGQRVAAKGSREETVRCVKLKFIQASEIAGCTGGNGDGT